MILYHIYSMLLVQYKNETNKKSQQFPHKASLRKESLSVKANCASCIITYWLCCLTLCNHTFHNTVLCYSSASSNRPLCWLIDSGWRPEIPHIPQQLSSALHSTASIHDFFQAIKNKRAVHSLWLCGKRILHS